MTDSQDFFLFSSEIKMKEGIKKVGSETLWRFSPDLSTIEFNTGTLSREFSISQLQLDSSIDEINSVGFLKKYSKAFIFANFRKVPTLFLLNFGEIPRNNSKDLKKFSSLSLSSLHFHNNIYDVFSPFDDAICIVSREGISIHSSNDLSIIFQKSAVFNPIFNCCYHKNVLTITNSNSLSIFQFTSKEQCKQVLKLKNANSKFIPKQILVSNNNIFLVLLNSTKFLIKHIKNCFDSSKQLISVNKSLDLIFPKHDNLNISLFDQALLISSLEKTVFVDLLGSAVVSFGELQGKPNSIFVNDNFIYSFTNETLYEFTENYRSIPDPCSFELISAIMRRKSGLQISMEKLETALKMCPKITSSTIEEIVQKIGTFATSPIEQIRFTQFLLYSGITNPHLILLAMIRYSNTLGAEMIPEAKKPLLYIMTKDECVYNVPSLLASWNVKLDKESMEYLLKANPLFYNLDISFFKDPVDFIQACFESGRNEKALDLILRETTRGQKNEKLTKVIKMYVDKKGDNIERSYKKLLLSMTTS